MNILGLFSPIKLLQRFNRRKMHISYMNDLQRIGQEVGDLIADMSFQKTKRVLMGPSFSIYEPCFIHDRILSYALRLRGAEIIPMYCDAVQSVECDVHAGVWMSKSFEEHCKDCVSKSKLLWKDNPLTAIALSKYIQNSEIQEIIKKVSSIGPDEWSVYTENDLPFGFWAKDILTNHYVVSDFHLISNYSSLGKVHLNNLLLLKIAYERLLADVKPERVIANDSYYGMYAIMQKLCERRKIPFYSHWSGGRQGTWCYAYNGAAMNLDFTKSWNNFSKMQLSSRQKDKVQGWLYGRLEGKEMVFDTASLAKHQKENADLDSLDLGKPTALLAANVIWDLAALNKQIVFEGMIEWIEETINWFNEHPNYQLIIKSHPAELHPSIPATKERVEIALKERGVLFTPNIFILSPKAKIRVYELFPIVKVGLVHTSTVGIEMAGRGLPVITTARSPYRGFGFTLDPLNKKDYFDILKKTLDGEKSIILDRQLDLSWKFILFYQYHYYTKINIMDYKWGQVPRLKIKTAIDLLPGKNKHLDYVVDLIMEGLPILDEERWPPES